MSTNIHACIFTGLPLLRWETSVGGKIYNYIIDVNERKHSFRFNKDESIEKWEDDIWFMENKYLLASLIYNNDWISNEEDILTLESLQDFLKYYDFPKTPQQKLENLFLTLFKYQRFDGDIIDAEKEFNPEGLNKWRCCFFKSFEEFKYYYFTLCNEDLIERTLTPSSRTEIQSCRITYRGLLHAIVLQNEGELSNKCFIAMSFKDDMKLTREAIENAVVTTGFEPILIDKQHIDSDKTINDAIIAALKRCKFCIADFTHHSDGVYFESGFALGQGKKVIYTCSKKDFRKSHFDIKPLQHIIYTSPEQLTFELINKIEAWIK